MTDHPRTSGTIFPPVNGKSGNGQANAQALAENGSTPAAGTGTTPATSSKPAATETIARRTGAMVNEIDFPGFVAQLVHGTFDAIVDASIRQMDSFAGLVSAVAKTVDQFTEENVSVNQARDWLASRYPGDVKLLQPDGERTTAELAPQAEGLTPVWLKDFGVEGEELTTELIEQRVLPQVRSHIGADRQQLLATMVMLGMNRVAVRDGSISAKVMFRAAAQDSSGVQYATSNDPKAVANWGERGSQTYAAQSTTMVSTLAVNAQNESTVRADLFGEVKINFVSEALPLERMVEPAKLALIQRHTPGMRTATAAAPAPAPAVAPDTQAPTHGGA